MSEKNRELDSLDQLIRLGNVISIDLWYPPRIPNHPDNKNADTIQVGLCDVRAADSIRISYDFDRDGYVIKQASTFDGEDEDWQEVAFISAWGREKRR